MVDVSGFLDLVLNGIRKPFEADCPRCELVGPETASSRTVVLATNKRQRAKGHSD